MEEYKTLDINKKILFLVSRIDAIPHVEMYLRKRDWSLKLTTGLKDAIAYLVQERPSYFFVSYDFPNKKALALVRSPALEHMTNIVLTGEVTKPNTIKGIQEFKIQYKLQPPMTGPAIERIVNKIIKDLEKQEEDIQENLKKGTLTKEQEKIIKIRSNKTSFGVDTIIQSGVGLGEMLSSSDEIGSVGIENSVSYDLSSNADPAGSLYKESELFEEAAAHSIDKNNPRSLSYQEMQDMTKNELEIGFNNLKETANSEFDETLASSVRTHFSKLKGKALKKRKDKNELDNGAKESSITQLDRMKALFRKAADKAFQEKSKNNDEISQSELAHLNKENLKKALEKIKKEASNSIDLDLTEDILRNFESLKQAEIERRQSHNQGAVYSHTENSKDMIIQSSREKRNKNMTLIETGTNVAVDSTFVKQRRTSALNRTINKTSKVSCILVESQKFKGYLLVSFSADRDVDLVLLDQMKQKLIQFLNTNGEGAKDTELMDLKMSEVAFEDWAIDQAEFLKNTNHRGQDVSVAFFPANQEFEELKERTQLKKFELSLDELRGDLVVEFDLHMYLERNKKLLLYTERGRTFYKNQKDRLTEKGMSKLYISPESKNDLKKYRVQNYLNDKIEEFKRKINSEDAS